MLTTRLLAAVFAVFVATSVGMGAQAQSPGYLRADEGRVVDEQGREVILRGMGLGGWMLQEGYMLQLSALGQQHVIRGRIEELIGPEKTQAFYDAWLDNHVTKADIDAMAAWGFNSVRLPIHYDQLTLPADREPTPGVDTWHEGGFERIDRLLEWVEANGMWLILDLHAAPGGQGADLAISDRDPAKPSLWDSAENRRKTVAVWRRLAERYADEPAIAGYDLINEPNWSFETPGVGNGCEDQANAPLWSLYQELTTAIRQVDDRHMIILGGNCWGNNYRGMPELWDDNLMLSFHKYWNANTPEALADIVRLREETDAPIWLGESGENSNVWFRDAIGLVEDHGAGWNFWPWKKIGFNQPLEIAPNPGWAQLVAYWTAGGPRPSAEEAEATLMRLATHDIRFENNIAHPDVIDAMLRQPHDATARPFAAHRIDASGGRIAAVDYDMGPMGVAWFDQHAQDLKGPRERVWWNAGRTYRNDGVDIVREADGRPVVSDFVDGEWLRYTFVAEAEGEQVLGLRLRSSQAARLTITLNGADPVVVEIAAGDGWREALTQPLRVQAGANTLIVRAEDCACDLESLSFMPRG